MSNFWPKQRSSRLIRLQELDYTGSSTLVTTPLLSQTYQVRVATYVNGYLAFGSTVKADRSTNQKRVDGAMRVLTNGKDPGVLHDDYKSYEGVD